MGQRNNHVLLVMHRKIKKDQTTKKKFDSPRQSKAFFASILLYLLFDAGRNSGHQAIVESPAKKSIQER